MEAKVLENRSLPGKVRIFNDREQRNLISWQIRSRFPLLDKSQLKIARDDALHMEKVDDSMGGCDEDGWA